MRWLAVAMGLALSAGGMAFAQTSTTGNAQISGDNGPNSSVVQPGLAKPPAGMAPITPPTQQPKGVPANMANNPTLPQAALQPSATVGSPVPIAGAGGTTKTVTGTNHQSFSLIQMLRKYFGTF